MGSTTVYDRTDIFGASFPGYDNSPNSSNSAWDKLFDPIVEDEYITGSAVLGYYPYILRINSTYNANKYEATFLFSGGSASSTYTGGSVSVNGKPLLIEEGYSISAAKLALLSGNPLEEWGSRGNDTITGNNQSDVLWGYGGNDAIYGRGGDDELNGGVGNDLLYGGAGDDTLNGWYGVDYIDGGSGVDTAIYNYSSGNYAPSVNSSGDIEIIFYWGGSEFLSNIEYLSFSDGIMATSQFGYVGSYSELSANTVSPVYRFYNTRDKAFFYTNSTAEANMVVDNSEPDSATNWPYISQGSTFEAAHSYLSTTPLFRFYNTSTGHHFFTTSTAEKDLVITNSESGLWPFNYEGVAMQVYASDPTSFVGEEVAVHRFYNPTLNRHFFTGDETEVAEIKLTGVWNYEGIGFWGEVV